MEAPRNLLEPAIEATRRALERMEEEEVPARLRRIAKISGGRLTAPHAERVLAELDQSVWLRNKALDHWGVGEAGPVSGERVASEAFLKRPQGWEGVVERAGEAFAAADHRKRLAALERERDALAAKLAETRARLESERAEAARRLEQEKASAEEKLGRALEQPARLRRELARLEAQLADSEGARALLASELAEADSRIAFLLERGVRGSTRQLSAGEASVGRGAPLATARTLDRFARAAEPDSSEVTGRSPESSPAMPKGVRPDRPEAIDWLLSLDMPVAVLVDGYNVAHVMGLGTDSEARARTQSLLARLRRLAMAPLSVTVFWDSALGVDSARGEGVAVTFVESADDAIVAAADARDGFVVVVSSDREVRERSERSGAMSFWSEALASWAGR